MTTPYTQATLDALDEAIASGHLRVKYADKEVQYRSMDELLRARAHVAKQLGQTNSRQRILTNFDKGLNGCADEDE